MKQKKVALVTGAGKKRIGWHVAHALAARGYDLIVHYNTAALDASETVHGLNSGENKAIGLQADLANSVSVKNLFERALEHFGRLDVLVNCAAIWQKKKLEDVTAEDVRRHLEVNTLGTFLCSQHAGLAMVDQPDGGCIVTIGDWATARPYENYSAYFPSKGAIPTLTRSLAVELGTRNPAVRVNCILPGPVLLPADLPERERQQAIAGTLVKREGRPEHITQAVLFLIENDFVTGICLPVDGGRSIYAPE
jgi:pteridine reductase